PSLASPPPARAWRSSPPHCRPCRAGARARRDRERVVALTAASAAARLLVRLVELLKVGRVNFGVPATPADAGAQDSEHRPFENPGVGILVNVSYQPVPQVEGGL